MILSKKKIANIENRLNELDNVNRHIQLDVITDLETPIKKTGTAGKTVPVLRYDGHAVGLW